MRVLGIKAVFHDPVAAFVVDGRLFARLRKRNDSRVASMAKAPCLSPPGRCPEGHHRCLRLVDSDEAYRAACELLAHVGDADSVKKGARHAF